LAHRTPAAAHLASEDGPSRYSPTGRDLERKTAEERARYETKKAKLSTQLRAEVAAYDAEHPDDGD
jgi:hypothetical protein